MGKWHLRFVRMAQEVATWSKDPDEGVGALLVSRDRRQFSPGYNGLPKSLVDDVAILDDKRLKNRLTVHAELNAIHNGPQFMEGWQLYCTKPPCTQCALSIMQRGIYLVVCPLINQTSRWAQDQRDAKDLLVKGRVVVQHYSAADLLQ